MMKMESWVSNVIGKPPLKLQKKDLLFILAVFLLFILSTYFYVIYSGINYQSQMSQYYSLKFKSYELTPNFEDRVTISPHSNIKDLKTYPLLEFIPITLSSEQNGYLLILMSDKPYYEGKIKDGFKIELKEMNLDRRKTHKNYRSISSIEKNTKFYFPSIYSESIAENISDISTLTFIWNYLNTSSLSKDIADRGIKKEISKIENEEKNLDLFGVLMMVLVIIWRLFPRYYKYQKRKWIFLKLYQEEDFQAASEVEVEHLAMSPEMIGNHSKNIKAFFYRVLSKGQYFNLIVPYYQDVFILKMKGKILKYQSEYYFVPTDFNIK